jgi:hypothetical protein
MSRRRPYHKVAVALLQRKLNESFRSGAVIPQALTTGKGTNELNSGCVRNRTVPCAGPSPASASVCQEGLHTVPGRACSRKKTRARRYLRPSTSYGWWRCYQSLPGFLQWPVPISKIEGAPQHAEGIVVGLLAPVISVGDGDEVGVADLRNGSSSSRERLHTKIGAWRLKSQRLTDR